jgi:hypothetical protein
MFGRCNPATRCSEISTGCLSKNRPECQKYSLFFFYGINRPINHLAHTPRRATGPVLRRESSPPGSKKSFPLKKPDAATFDRAAGPTFKHNQLPASPYSMLEPGWWFPTRRFESRNHDRLSVDPPQQCLQHPLSQAFNPSPRDAPEPGHEAGTINDWPTCRRLGFNPGFAAISASSFTLYFRAIPDGVSPV